MLLNVSHCAKIPTSVIHNYKMMRFISMLSQIKHFCHLAKLLCIYLYFCVKSRWTHWIYFLLFCNFLCHALQNGESFSIKTTWSLFPYITKNKKQKQVWLNPQNLKLFLYFLTYACVLWNCTEWKQSNMSWDTNVQLCFHFVQKSLCRSADMVQT